MTAFAVVAFALLAPTAASALTADYWYDSKTGSAPTVYYTNTPYQGAIYNPTKTIPAGALITSVSFTYQMNGPVPAGTTLEIYLCQGTSGYSSCAKVNSASTPSGSGTTTAFNGLTPNQPFRFAAVLRASTTYSLATSYKSSNNSLQVSYEY